MASIRRRRISLASPKHCPLRHSDKIDLYLSVRAVSFRVAAVVAESVLGADLVRDASKCTSGFAQVADRKDPSAGRLGEVVHFMVRDVIEALADSQSLEITQLTEV